jgi:site-specific DNA-methyltransferase (adenine-specific)
MTVIHAHGDAYVLYRGDAHRVLRDLSAADQLPRLGAVISDPPYESHMHAAKRGVKVKGSARRIRRDGHANPPPVEFPAVTEGDRALVCRSAKSHGTGWLLAFCTPEGIAPWRDAVEAAGLRYKRACFWVKPDGAPQMNGQGPAMSVECIVSAWAGEGHSHWNGGGRRNVFTFTTNNDERWSRTHAHESHPTEKPLPLMRELISLFSDPGDWILDPYMGTGTTGVAAIQTGRKFIGIERDDTWFNVAARRLHAARPQYQLGLAVKAPPIAQEVML